MNKESATGGLNRQNLTVVDGTLDGRIRANAYKYRMVAATLVAGLIQQNEHLDLRVALWGIGILEKNNITPESAKALLVEVAKEELGISPMPEEIMLAAASLPSKELLEAWESIVNIPPEERFVLNYRKWGNSLVDRMKLETGLDDWRSSVVKIAAAQVSAVLQTLMEGIAPDALSSVLPSDDDVAETAKHSSPALMALMEAETAYLTALHAVAMEEKDESSPFANDKE